MRRIAHQGLLPAIRPDPTTDGLTIFALEQPLGTLALRKWRPGILMQAIGEIQYDTKAEILGQTQPAFHLLQRQRMFLEHLPLALHLAGGIVVVVPADRLVPAVKADHHLAPLLRLDHLRQRVDVLLPAFAFPFKIIVIGHGHVMDPLRSRRHLGQHQPVKGIQRLAERLVRRGGRRQPQSEVTPLDPCQWHLDARVGVADHALHRPVVGGGHAEQRTETAIAHQRRAPGPRPIELHHRQREPGHMRRHGRMATGYDRTVIAKAARFRLVPAVEISHPVLDRQGRPGKGRGPGPPVVQRTDRRRGRAGLDVCDGEGTLDFQIDRDRFGRGKLEGFHQFALTRAAAQRQLTRHLQRYAIRCRHLVGQAQVMGRQPGHMRVFQRQSFALGELQYRRGQLVVLIPAYKHLRGADLDPGRGIPGQFRRTLPARRPHRARTGKHGQCNHADDARLDPRLHPCLLSYGCFSHARLDPRLDPRLHPRLLSYGCLGPRHRQAHNKAPISRQAAITAQKAGWIRAGCVAPSNPLRTSRQ